MLCKCSLAVVGSDTEWDFNWADKEWMRENFDGMRLEEHQRVNHYRNYYELCRKDLLIKNLKRMRKTIERDDQKVNGEDGAKYPSLPRLPSHLPPTPHLIPLPSLASRTSRNLPA